MEDFLSSNSTSTKSQFPAFLEFYVDTIYPKRKLFAQDIDVNPISLSQVINNHKVDLKRVATDVLNLDI